MVFPDTSPRDTKIQSDSDIEYVGPSAGFYVDATTEKWGKHYNMFTYINEELPKIVTQYFPVSN
jgi:S-formylglutathione hydrolase